MYKDMESIYEKVESMRPETSDKTSVNVSIDHSPEWFILCEMSQTLKDILKALENLHVSNTPKWGSKIDAEQFWASERVIKEAIEYRQKESEKTDTK